MLVNAVLMAEFEVRMLLTSVAFGSAVIDAPDWLAKKRCAEIAPLPIAAQVRAVLLPATGASALALAAVTRLPPVMLPAMAADFASPLAPWPMAVADAVPARTPPLPPVAVACEVIEVVPMALTPH